jgi:cbb3-type cytochrome oxidase subunit 1
VQAIHILFIAVVVVFLVGILVGVVLALSLVRPQLFR